MRSPAKRPSLRTELLATFGILVAAAVLVAVTMVLLVGDLSDGEPAAFWLSALVATDVVVLVSFGAYQLRRLVLHPLNEAIAAAEAIAAGDLARRVPEGPVRELAALAASVNRMTDHLLAEQAGRSRVEKMATVGRLAAGVAHEIGNPLGAINGYTHLLRSRVRDQSDALDALDGLDRESARIDRIVRGLLDYARPRRPTPTPVDLNDVVRSAVGLLRDQGVLRRLTVRCLLDDATPRLVGERHELEQVLVNLLLNAADAVPPAGGEIVVTTRLATVASMIAGAPRRSGDSPDVEMPRTPSMRLRSWLDRADTSAVVQLVVADSGPGVPDDDAERIFDPFYTTKEPGKGTGLGLAIVARVVEGLRGTVWVQRAREGGAAFVLLFPATTIVRRPEAGAARLTTSASGAGAP
jgi:signal transduction histidine kinase